MDMTEKEKNNSRLVSLLEKFKEEEFIITVPLTSEGDFSGADFSQKGVDADGEEKK